jgi:2'-5' RNA ligase
VYSLNVPVPGAVERLAGELHPKLTAFDRIRDRHAVVCKRFETGEDEYHRLRERLRPTLSPTPAFEAAVTGIDAFSTPPRGSAPVVYLAVESPGLRDLHRRLVDRFGSVHAELEGPEYVPHVTLARGGPAEAAECLRETRIDPITWTVSELELWSHARRSTVWTVPLPRP